MLLEEEDDRLLDFLDADRLDESRGASPPLLLCCDDDDVRLDLDDRPEDTPDLLETSDLPERPELSIPAASSSSSIVNN